MTPSREPAGAAAVLPAARRALAHPQLGAWAFVAGVALLLAGWATSQPTPVLVSCFLLTVSALRRLLVAPRVAALGLAFLAALGVFLLVRPLLEVVGYPPGSTDQYAMPFNRPDANTHVFVCLALSLIGLQLGWWMLPHARGKGVRATPRRYRSDALVPSIRVASVALLSVALLCHVALGVEAALFVRDASYFDLYTTFSSSLPVPVRVLGQGASAVFLCYLATDPRPRNVWWASGAYLAAASVSLLSGQRTELVLSVTVVVVYLTYRSATDPSGHRWVSRRMALAAVAAVPVALGVLALVGRTRTLQARRAEGLLGPLWDTLYAQSSSLEVVGYGYVYRAQVPPEHLYSLGHVLDLLGRRLPGLVGIGDGPLSGQSVERAEQSGIFGQLLSYRVLGEEYLKGRGLGSSYLAELWADAGVLGVLLGSVLLGAVIWQLTVGLHRSWEVRLVCLLLAREVVLAPRSGYSQFIVEAFTSSTLVGVGLVLLGALAVRRWVQPAPAPGRARRAAEVTS